MRHNCIPCIAATNNGARPFRLLLNRALIALAFFCVFVGVLSSKVVMELYTHFSQSQAIGDDDWSQQLTGNPRTAEQSAGANPPMCPQSDGTITPGNELLDHKVTKYGCVLTATAMLFQINCFTRVRPLPWQQPQAVGQSSL